MKIPFDIKYRPQIESGEYKVETRDGKPARILCWDKVDNCGQYIVALVQYTPEHENMISVCEDGIYKGTYGHGYDLFIITPEPELSEFEKKFQKIISDWQGDSSPFEDNMSYLLHKDASELLSLARKELCEQIVDHTKEAYENGKAEALKDLPRWRYKKGGTGPILHDCLVLNKYGCIGKSPSGALLGDVWILEYDELAKLPKED